MTATSPTEVVVLTSHNTNTAPLVEGPTIRLTNASGPTTAGLELLGIQSVWHLKS